mmetsp:Transcript_98031/g.194053  ORF Transcript_98031/g.194053 Transcript_98031/m.194053 type:complete len:213 (-) Transcript_98031:514-1152(-)
MEAAAAATADAAASEGSSSSATFSEIAGSSASMPPVEFVGCSDSPAPTADSQASCGEDWESKTVFVYHASSSVVSCEPSVRVTANSSSWRRRLAPRVMASCSSLASSLDMFSCLAESSSNFRCLASSSLRSSDSRNNICFKVANSFRWAPSSSASWLGSSISDGAGCCRLTLPALCMLPALFTQPALWVPAPQIGKPLTNLGGVSRPSTSTD